MLHGASAHEDTCALHLVRTPSGLVKVWADESEAGPMPSRQEIEGAAQEPQS